MASKKTAVPTIDIGTVVKWKSSGQGRIYVKTGTILMVLKPGVDARTKIPKATARPSQVQTRSYESRQTRYLIEASNKDGKTAYYVPSVARIHEANPKLDPDPESTAARKKRKPKGEKTAKKTAKKTGASKKAGKKVGKKKSSTKAPKKAKVEDPTVDPVEAKATDAPKSKKGGKKKTASKKSAAKKKSTSKKNKKESTVQPTANTEETETAPEETETGTDSTEGDADDGDSGDGSGEGDAQE